MSAYWKILHGVAPVGLPDMSARFEMRKPARKNRLPSPACPAGSKVPFSASQRQNVILAECSGSAKNRIDSGKHIALSLCVVMMSVGAI